MSAGGSGGSLGDLDREQEHGHVGLLKRGLHDAGTTGADLLRPSERNEIDVRLVGNRRDELMDVADPDLELNVVDSPWAIAAEKLARARFVFMLRLVRECGHR